MNILKADQNTIKAIVFWTFYCLFLYFIVLTVMSKSLDFFFWKDDWYLKWAGSFNPDEFYQHFPYWQLRAPEFWLRQIITDSRNWQQIGILLKVLNSIIFTLFIAYFLKKKELAIYSGILYAVYSGGLETYTWAIINGILISILLIGLILFDKYIRYKKRIYLLSIIILFFLLNALYFGRALGIFPLIFFMLFLYLIKEKPKYKYLFTTILVLGVPSLVVLMNFASSLIADLNFDFRNFILYLKEYKLFLGSIGNLIRIPFFRLYEVGGLTVNDSISVFSGTILFFLTSGFFILYLIKRSRFLYLVNMSLMWVIFFYFINWMWGGGGVYTMVGSTHRYLSLSAVGYLFFLVLLLSKIPKNIRSVLVVYLIVAFTKYTLYVVDIEDNVRNKAKVEPIYQEVVRTIPSEVETPFILIDTPNQLKSFVVGGWFPHAFGYYRGIKSSEKLPTVFSFKADAVRWFCEADHKKKKEITLSAGGADYSGKNFEEEEIFAWYLEENGKLSDQKGAFISEIRKCIN